MIDSAWRRQDYACPDDGEARYRKRECEDRIRRNPGKGDRRKNE
jgi:hypothetical protein